MRRSWAVLVLTGILAVTGSLSGLPGAQPAPARVLAPLGDSLEAIHATAALPRATWYNDRDGDKVFDSLVAEFERTRLPVLPAIVTFRRDADFVASMAAAKEALGGALVRYELPVLAGFAADLSLSDVRNLADLGAVRQIEWSQSGRPELDTATTNLGVRAVQEQLNVTGDLDGLSNMTAQDVTIAILDTGFDPHVDFTGKVLAFLDAEDKTLKDPYDSDLHGTHVASIAAGLGRGDPKYRGVAPGAALVGVKITGEDPNPATKNVNEYDVKGATLYGIDWILQHRAEYGIRVLTLSFGFGTTKDGTDALELAMDKVFAAGILPFKSAGNSGPEPGTITVPGGARGIIAVANMMDPGRSEAKRPLVSGQQTALDAYDYGFRLANLSSRGPTTDGRVKPDLAAPGTSIMAARNKTADGYRVLSGTSMASPFAAGIAALVFGADPSLTPSQARDVLFNATEDWGEPGLDRDYGRGRIDALRAVQTVLMARLAREHRPDAEILGVANATGPSLPGHSSGILDGTSARATVRVVDATRPFAVTVIQAPGMLDPTTVTPSLPRRLVLLTLVGPDASVVKVSLSPRERQQWFAIEAPSAGDYTLNAIDLPPEARLIYDVSAGLAASAARPLDAPKSVAAACEGSPNATGAACAPAGSHGVPGFGAGGLVVGLLVAVVVGRRLTSRGR